MLKKYHTKMMLTSCFTLLLSLLILLLVSSSIFMDREKVSMDGTTVTVYPGNGEFGVVLISSNPSQSSLLLRAVGRTGATIVHSKAAANIRTLISFLSDYTNIAKDKIFLIEADECAGDILNEIASLEHLAGCVFIHPTVRSNLPTFSDIHFPILITGQIDTVLRRDEELVNIYNTLAKDIIVSNGRPIHAQKNKITLALTPSAVSSDALFSTGLLTVVTNYLCDGMSVPRLSKSVIPPLKTVLWMLVMVSLIASLWLLNLSANSVYSNVWGVVWVKIKSNALFLFGRFAYWLFALPLTFAIWMLLTVFSVSFTVAGRVLLAYLAGCSVTMGLLHGFKTPKIFGKTSEAHFYKNLNGKRYAALLFMDVLLTGAFLFYSGMWSYQISAQRMVLFVVLWAVFFISLLAALKDAAHVSSAVQNKAVAMILLLIPYFPLLGLAAIYVPMGQIAMAVAVAKILLWLAVSVLCAANICVLTNSANLAAMGGSAIFTLIFAFQQYL